MFPAKSITHGSWFIDYSSLTFSLLTFSSLTFSSLMLFSDYLEICMKKEIPPSDAEIAPIVKSAHLHFGPMLG